jgi:hypothetical protein
MILTVELKTQNATPLAITPPPPPFSPNPRVTTLHIEYLE